MKLNAFQLENYRSIRACERLVLGKSLTTLIGPNNEGKSNILRALVASLGVLEKLAERHLIASSAKGLKMRSFGSNRDIYSWEHDFPLSLQPLEQDGGSNFILEFELSSGEMKRTQTTIGRALKGFLTFSIRCGASEWSVKANDEIGEFETSGELRNLCRLAGSAITPQYIPSVRTAESAEEIIDDVIRTEFLKLRSEKKYRDAVRAIEEVEEPVVTELAAAVTKTLGEFLPTVKRVRLELSRRNRIAAMRSACKIVVHDGTETDLKQKGDGIQSLAAMSLMRYAALRNAGKRRIILAVEEPETHLHSRAIHQLRSVLNEIAANNQVIITTHNPVFVNRDQVSTNILVSENNASPAQSTEQIREILGVRPSDNLRHAEVVLVVEGEDDRLALNALLRAHSKPLSRALSDGLLAIDPLHGSSNLSFKLSLIRAALCSAYVFVDYDDAGKKAVDKALSDRLLSNAEVKYAMCRGKEESELEDLYALTFVEPIVKDAFGIQLVKPLMRGRCKWSERVGQCFKAQGQVWDDAAKAAVKLKVATAVKADPKAALLKTTRGPFDALVKALEERIKATGNPAA